MAGSVATSVLEVVHDKDPKQVIWDDLKGWLDLIAPTAGDCIIAVYQRPEKTKGGLIVPETASRRAEDAFQGTVGMIVKVGPKYEDHAGKLGLDHMPKIGDWVAFRTQDCTSFVLGKRPMRLTQGNFIRMTLSDPDAII